MMMVSWTNFCALISDGTADFCGMLNTTESICPFWILLSLDLVVPQELMISSIRESTASTAIFNLFDTILEYIHKSDHYVIKKYEVLGSYLINLISAEVFVGGVLEYASSPAADSEVDIYVRADHNRVAC